ncbi:hypothetical protein [Vibrio fluvialis]|uniref:hypothetical protein n=1 Tax=Vibrio fluvialis TaxID=676 RepID=UPI001302402A|nr:hypothetical protein [Vibrio fluvialis]
MQFKDFVGYPYDKEKSEEQARLDDATEVLNDWLTKNEKVKVVNVESIYSSQGTMMGSTEPKFKNLRVWYNVV